MATRRSRLNYRALQEARLRRSKRGITIKSYQRFDEEDIIESDEYIQSKKAIDEMTMSSLVYQLQAGERALTILLQIKIQHILMN